MKENLLPSSHHAIVDDIVMQLREQYTAYVDELGLQGNLSMSDIKKKADEALESAITLLNIQYDERDLLAAKKTLQSTTSLLIYH